MCSRCSGVQLGIEQKTGHAQNTIHRRANFMADVGNEFGLEPRGFQRAAFPDVGLKMRPSLSRLRSRSIRFNSMNASRGQHADDRHAAQSR